MLNWKKTNSIDVTCDVREKKRNYMIYRSPLSDLPSRAALHVATLSKDSLLDGAIGIDDDTAVEVDAVSLSGLNSSTTRQRTLTTKDIELFNTKFIWLKGWYLAPWKELPMSWMTSALARLCIRRWVVQVTAVSVVHGHRMGRRLMLLLWQQSFLFALFGHVTHAHAAVSGTLWMVNHAPSIKGNNVTKHNYRQKWKKKTKKRNSWSVSLSFLVIIIIISHRNGLFFQLVFWWL